MLNPNLCILFTISISERTRGGEEKTVEALDLEERLGEGNSEAAGCDLRETPTHTKAHLVIFREEEGSDSVTVMPLGDGGC